MHFFAGGSAVLGFEYKCHERRIENDFFFSFSFFEDEYRFAFVRGFMV